MIDIISSNMDIGSHGWGHVDWRRVDDKMLDVEFDEALKKIADTLGCAIAKVSNRIRELRVESCVDCDTARQRRSSRAMGAALR
jgi:peptidoglycan/xylan/chitin deacetylase (PgdA/CDA1 family)